MRRPSFRKRWHAEAPQGRVLLVASSGGHLAQLHQIATTWRPEQRRWVSFDTGNAPFVLAGESVTWAFHPTNRNIVNLLRNVRLAWRDVAADPPRAFVSTGAGVAVPFAVACRLRHIPVIYIESMARSDRPSLTGKILYPLATRFFVQWPEMVRHFPRAEFHGSSFDFPDARHS
jgi:UDP-N-acetylglucosamine:LPS N-acetylglucosamine transferase